MGWGVSLLLGFAAPWRRAILATPGSGSPPIDATVVAMLAVFLLARRRPQAFFSALLMSAGGLGIGCSVAFATLFAFTHKPLGAALAAKWLVIGSALTIFCVRQMRQAVTPPPEFSLPSLEGLTRAESLEALSAFMCEAREESTRLRRRSNRLLVVGAVLCLAGLATMALLESHRLEPAQESLVLTVVGTILLVGGTGAWRASRKP